MLGRLVVMSRSGAGAEVRLNGYDANSKFLHSSECSSLTFARVETSLQICLFVVLVC